MAMDATGFMTEPTDFKFGSKPRGPGVKDVVRREWDTAQADSSKVTKSRTADAALTERWSDVGEWEALAALGIAVLALHATGGIRARSGVWCLRGDGGHEGENGEEDATHGC
ncbi:cytochrome P450 [Colletotrichum fioriniae PJ7]|uniref:Cytochrome P450 n=1 Tax=Colletotrichum fioriniae PJ7 TaxID=1445577 RepID=A0A010QWX0_9PEZI|nr:cytochrome P450 [Colletotrichum fioriniae PJ7]